MKRRRRRRRRRKRRKRRRSEWSCPWAVLGKGPDRAQASPFPRAPSCQAALGRGMGVKEAWLSPGPSPFTAEPWGSALLLSDSQFVS